MYKKCERCDLNYIKITDKQNTTENKASAETATSAEHNASAENTKSTELLCDICIKQLKGQDTELDDFDTQEALTCPKCNTIIKEIDNIKCANCESKKDKYEKDIYA
ncbi:MAG: hypothetical protein FWB72_05135 [Firmicutes bacterium]|nr:hypothetical protein [Bacillota bacterium]